MQQAAVTPSDSPRPLRLPPSRGGGMSELPPELLQALTSAHLLRPGERPVATPLTGGVSSDIWRVDLAAGPVCLKRALAKLKVAADWRAPVSRNAYEVAWMETAASLVPQAVPRLRATTRTPAGS